MDNSIRLNVEPGVIKKWSEFTTNNPKYSIALDGYVKGPTKFKIDESGPYANFNHHEGVNRLSTASTCFQVCLYIRQGLLDTFSKDGVPFVDVFINDPDQDTTLARWLFSHYHFIGDEKYDMMIESLVGMENKLDITGGIYGINPKMPIMKSITWIFKPYTDARIQGKLNGMTKDSMLEIINAVSDNITAYVNKSGKMIEPTTDYEKLGGGDGWVLIKEKGTNVRNVIFHNGTYAFVSVVENSNGTYNYTLGRLSNLVRFPILKMFRLFNELEGISETDLDRWGGGNTIGGSPRLRGSKLTPQIIEQEINKLLKESKK